MTGKQHDSGVRRLDAALIERDRSAKRYDDALGTPAEVDAEARLCAASEQVTAREAWLHWVDDEGYRGLNAGPFALRAEHSGEERARGTRPRAAKHRRAGDNTRPLTVVEDW